MVVQVKVSGGDLLANAQNEPKAALGIASQLQGANHQARADEILHAPVIGAAVNKGGTDVVTCAAVGKPSERKINANY
jgi:hypothetical protein